MHIKNSLHNKIHCNIKVESIETPKAFYVYGHGIIGIQNLQLYLVW